MAEGVTLQRLVADGVPVHYVPDEGPARAGLTFRVGRVDEQAALSGITHVVEHLALFRFGQQPFEYNGAVDPIRTMFMAVGREAEVADYLQTVCRNLADLPLDRLSAELRVLRNEGSRRAIGPVEHHGWLRWGLRSTGIGFLAELGLWRLTPDEVRDWAATYFVAANAALVWVGPEPPALSLPLPPGARVLPPEPADDLAGPVWATGAPDHVALSFVVVRGSAEASTQRILAKRLQQQLRYDRGLSYDVSMHYQPLSARLATSTIWATCADGDAAAVRDVVVDAARALERDGPTAAELAADLDGMQRAREGPAALGGEADRRAIQELLGAEPDTMEQLERQLAAVTPEAARVAMATAIRTTILTQPESVGPPPEWLASYPNQLVDAVGEGRRFIDTREKPFSPTWKFPVLVTSERALALEMPDRTGVVMPWSEVAAAIYGEDGSCTVLHETGSQIPVHPLQWRDAAVLQREIAARVPSERIVPMTPDGATPTWTSPALHPIAMAVAFAGMLFLLSGAAVFVDRPPAPIVAGPVAVLTGIAFALTAALLPVLAYGASTFRTWSRLAAAAVIASAVGGAILGSTIQAVSAGVMLLLPVPFAALHLWKVRWLHASQAGGAAST